MDVGTCGNVPEEDFAEGKRKSVAHCIDEDVGWEEGEGVPC